MASSQEQARLPNDLSLFGSTSSDGLPRLSDEDGPLTLDSPTPAPPPSLSNLVEAMAQEAKSLLGGSSVSITSPLRPVFNSARVHASFAPIGSERRFSKSSSSTGSEVNFDSAISVALPISHTNLEGLRESSSGELMEHPVYYEKADHVVLLVEKTLYRLPRSTLNRSSMLRHKADHREEGEDLVITMPGVSCDEMDTLLRLLNSRVIDNDLQFTLDDLASILSVATRWGFHGARDWAIKQLDLVEQDAISRLDLAIKWHVRKWVEPAYVELCTQTGPWSSSQTHRLVEVLGPVRFATLTGIRERSRQCSGCGMICGEVDVPQHSRHTALQISSIKDAIQSSPELNP